jgi:hypothetical protein
LRFFLGPLPASSVVGRADLRAIEAAVIVAGSMAIWVLIAAHRATPRPREFFLGEWDIFKGRPASLASSPSWYAEMHPAKNGTSGYVATIWENVAGHSTSLVTIPLVEQCDITFTSTWGGSAACLREQRSTPFTFSHDATHSATLALRDGRTLQLTIHATNAIEILIGDLAATAVRQVPVEIPGELLALKATPAPVSGPIQALVHKVPEEAWLLGGALLAAAVLGWILSAAIAALCMRPAKASRAKGDKRRADRSREKHKDGRREKDKDSRGEKDKDSRREKDKDSRKEKDKDSRREKDKDSRKEKDKDSRREKDKDSRREKDKDEGKRPKKKAE